MDVTVALCGSGRRSVAEHGIHTRWRHHRSLGMAFVHGRVDPAPVIRAIAGQRGHRPGDLIEQGADQGGVIDAALSQHGGDDPARARLQEDRLTVIQDRASWGHYTKVIRLSGM